MLVGIFSPLCKMFAPFHEVYDENGKPVIRTIQDLQDNPEEIFSKQKFSILVPRSSGDIRFIFGQPRFFKDPDVVDWLTGGETGEHRAETQWTGCVQMQVSPDAMGEMMASIASGEKVSNEVDSKLAQATKAAERLSEIRAMKQVRFVWKNYLSQVELNKEQNLGTPSFSPVEYLCSRVLSQELNDVKARDEKRRQEMESLTMGLMAGEKTYGPRT